MTNDPMHHDAPQGDTPADGVLQRMADALAESDVELFITDRGEFAAQNSDPNDPVHLEPLVDSPTWRHDVVAADELPQIEAPVTGTAMEAAVRPVDAPEDDEGPSVPQAGQRARVVPSWVADRRVLLPWVGARVVDGVSLAGFHVVRSPWYALQGTAQLVRGLARWVAQSEDNDQYAADMKRAGSMQARSRLRWARTRGRLVRFVLATSPVAAGLVWLEYGQWGLVPAVTCAAGYVGLAASGWWEQKKARSPREQAAMRRRVPALSRPFVTEALAIVGCGPVDMPSGGQAGPVIVSSSPARGGEVMVVDLPPGTNVGRLLKRHEDFAHALGRPAECVVIEAQPKVSPGRFELFVASKRLDEKKPPQWAWADGKAQSFFDGVPVGVDARDRTVVVPLFEANGLIAGATGMGKSFTARLLLMGAALDPNVTLLIHNLKGGPDYRPFAPVAHTLRAGGGQADLEALHADLQWMRSEIGRRGRVLEALPPEEVPEGKLTPQIAAREGMGPVLLLVDEAQRAFASKKLGKQIAELFEDVVRTGRAVGMSVHVVTQGTKDGAIPSGIMDQLPRRIGHGVTTISDANLILGSDAHGRTYRAVDIDTPGIAYVGVAGGDMEKARMAKVDLPDVTKIIGKARELREQAGTLSGMAAGHVPADEHDGGTGAFLADVLGAWPMDGDEPRKNASSKELAEALVECDPGEYDGLTGEDVSRRMAAAGVKVSSQRLPGGGSARGVKRADVVRAASAVEGS